MSDRWYYNSNGERFGPIDDAALRALAAAGTVNRATPVQRAGDAAWIPAAQVPGLFAADSVPTIGDNESTLGQAVAAAEAPAVRRGALLLILSAGAAAAGIAAGVWLAVMPGTVEGPAGEDRREGPDVPSPKSPGLGVVDGKGGTIAKLEKTTTEQIDPKEQPVKTALPDDLTPLPPLKPTVKTAVEPPKTVEKSEPAKVEPVKTEPAPKVEAKTETKVAQVEPTVPKTEPKTEPTPKSVPQPKTRQELMAEAEALYSDVFGPYHDLAARSPPTKKVEFAFKLARCLALASDTPELARLLRLRAAGFAEADPAGYDLALAMLREATGEPGAARMTASVLEKRLAREKPGPAATRMGLELTAAYLDTAEEALAAKRFDEAVEASTKAKKAAVRYAGSNKKLTAEIDEYDRYIAAYRKAQLQREAVAKALLEDAEDAKANLAEAMYRLCVDDKPAEAASHFLKSGSREYRALGEVLRNKEATLLETADALRAAALAAGRDEAPALTAQAARRYRAVLEAEPNHPDAVRIRLLTAQAPKETPAVVVAKPKVELPEVKPEGEPNSVPAVALTAADTAGTYAVHTASGIPVMTVILYANGNGTTERGVNRTFFTWTLQSDTIVVQFPGAAESFKYKSTGTFVGVRSGQVMTKVQ